MRASTLFAFWLYELAASIPAPNPQPIAARGTEDTWISPVYTDLFSQPLAFPPVKQPLTTYVNSTTGETFDFYQIHIKKFQAELYPGHNTTLIGYDGIFPGPTFVTEVGRRSVVRFVNEGLNPSSIHLHGAPSRPAFDGWAEDTLKPGDYKDYVWPNVAARTTWYHDHAAHHTAINAFYGQAGYYIVQNSTQEAELKLPKGAYDVPLALVDQIYEQDYELRSPAGETTNYYGDVITVNGVPWPYLDVEPRKYRFRMTDMSISRSYKVAVQTSEGKKVPFSVIATDAGYIETPIPIEDLIIAPGERYEFILDFTPFATQNLTLTNARSFGLNFDYAHTHQILQFRILPTPTSTLNNGPLPPHLTTLSFPTAPTRISKTFIFGLTNGRWTINGLGFSDANRILAKPAFGATEVWRLVNTGTQYTHPIHMHLIDFKVLTRTGGGRGVERYEVGYKDTVMLFAGEQVTVVARWQPWRGEYMFHCHNLIHEDDDMMATVDVGDTHSSTAGGDVFTDPMNPAFRPRRYEPVPIETVEKTVLPYFASLDIYTGFK